MRAESRPERGNMDDVTGIPLNGSLRSYNAREVSDDTSIDTGDESLVQQQFRDEVDINVIVRRFGLTREMPSGIAGGVYGDFTDIQDYDDAVARIERADAGFMRLPAEVRELFDNSPSKLIEKVHSLPEAEFVSLVEGVRPRPAVDPVRKDEPA